MVTSQCNKYSIYNFKFIFTTAQLLFVTNLTDLFKNFKKS